MGFVLRGCVAGALLALGAAAHASDPGRAEFDAGVAAYRAGDREAALQKFESARAAGYDTPQLRFNLGLCYYQLRRYAEARAQFEVLRTREGYAGVADFHLGLIAAREGDRARAASLGRGLEAGADAALARRAGFALGRIDAGAAAPVPSGYLFAGVGHDSNPALIEENLQPGARGGSPELDLLGAINWPVAGDARAFTALRGGAYLKDYTEDIGQDQRGAFAGVSRELDDGARRLSVGLDASTSTFDGERLLDAYTVQAQRAPSAGPGWRFGAQASLLEAPRTYAGLEGWRARASVARSVRAGATLVRLGYEFERNERDDPEQSPDRHRVEVLLDHPGGARTTLRWSLRWRQSRFDAAGREEDLAQAGLQLRRQLGATTYALLDLQYSDNDAPGAYAYERRTALLGLEWTPTAR